jgi:hypothetical protein
MISDVEEYIPVTAKEIENTDIDRQVEIKQERLKHRQ